MDTPSAHVTYQGDARKPDETRPYEIAGFPFSFPVQEAIEITEDFVRETFNRQDFRDFVTFLFDGEHAVYNIHLKSPRFLVAWLDEAVDEVAEESKPKPSRSKVADPAPDPAPEPTADPAPEPLPEPTPEPAPDPTPEPEATE